MKLKLLALGLATTLSLSANALEFATIQMDNWAYVILTDINCPFSKTSEPKFGYVVKNTNDYVDNVCWMVVQDRILVVTRQGEYQDYPVENAEPIEVNKPKL